MGCYLLYYGLEIGKGEGEGDDVLILAIGDERGKHG